MKRKLLCIALTLVCLFSAVSCHGELGEPKIEKEYLHYELPEALDTETPIELVFWSKNDTNMAQKKLYQAAKAEFEAIYQNVTVTIRTYTNYNDIYNDVIKNLATGTTPNICITYPDHIATYMTGGDTIVPLDDLMNHATFGLGAEGVAFDAPTGDELIPKFLEECKINANHYALPFMRSTEACYINRELVEKLGYEVPDVLTWEYVFEVSAKAMEKNADGTYKVNGQKTLIPFIYKSTDNMMIQMLEQLEAGYSTEEGKIELFNEDTAGILKMIAGPAASKSFSTFKKVSYPGNYFNAGQCIFAIDSTAGATWMGSYSPLTEISEENTAIFKTEVRAIPQFNTESPRMISQGPSMCIFNKENKQEVLYSWLFMQYLLTDGIQIPYSQTEGYAPVTYKAQNTAEYTEYLKHAGDYEAEYLAYKALPKDQQDKTKLRELKNLHSQYYDVKIAATKLLLDNTDNTFVTAVFNGSTSLRNAAGALIEDTCDAARLGETVDDAFIDELYSKINTRYHLDDFVPKDDADGDGEESEKPTVTEPEPLPTEAKVLIGVLCTAWVLIGAYFLYGFIKGRKNKNLH